MTIDSRFCLKLMTVSSGWKAVGKTRPSWGKNEDMRTRGVMLGEGRVRLAMLCSI